ncbi:Uncharacterised protein [Bordetella pertussis]|nr:Uncharacterised protein [Bordetella pertussis]
MQHGLLRRVREPLVDQGGSAQHDQNGAYDGGWLHLLSPCGKWWMRRTIPERLHTVSDRRCRVNACDDAGA